ncbi:SDR family oxidoreductase [Photobacterium lucens]|uniref:SDR family oxidoreductase n=1 Tax=Photobacterium lucens TaxID=2562949 RepID=UPI00136ABA20|nr:SDR family oxidoreductase [Photobacterium lucens]MBP2700661.1 SDR family oxidoreductase [Vibrio parahaemolyticus]MZG55380.1 SDR family oxidoreductase [Photobacterium lucens]MZG81215.1 SDR family oxidoreductase [Photobacterium lucens]
MQVAICGCGWLGLPLAKALYKQGCNVYGTKTTLVDAKLLAQWGINGFQMQLPLESCEQIEYLAPLLASDVMVINIAAGRHAIDKEQHYQNVMSLSHAAENAGCKRIIFISTTSVYDGRQGKVVETDDVMPITSSALVHVKIEQALREQWGEKLTILRLSGLIGDDRHPVKFLAGRQGIKDGNSPVNLIHLDDCIAAICRLIEKKAEMPVLHLAAGFHPSRHDYYTQMAKQRSLPLPQFEMDNSDNNGKVIDASATLAWLGISLKYNDLLINK